MPNISLRNEVAIALTVILFLSLLALKLGQEITKMTNLWPKAKTTVSTARPLGQQILAVIFEYKPQEKQASIQNLSVGQGTLIENTVTDLSHALVATLKDDQGQTIYKTMIRTNEEIAYEPPTSSSLTQNENSPPLPKPDKITLSLKVPYMVGSKLTISLPTEEVLVEFTITQVGQATTIKEKTATVAKTVEPLGLGPLVPLETIWDGNPAETDPTKMIDFVIIPSSYSATVAPGKKSFDDLHQEAVASINMLVGVGGKPGKAPFTLPANKSLLRVKVALTEESFHLTPGPGEYWTRIDYDKVYSFLNSQQITYDKFFLFVPVSDRSYSTLDGDYFVLFTDQYLTSYLDGLAMVFIHELGHAFGGLEDEYLERSCENYFSYSNPFETERESNCKSGETTPWLNDLDSPNVISCHNNLLWYRPSKSSIMRSTGTTDEFNEVSKILIQRKFDRYSQEHNLLVTPKNKVIFRKAGDESKGFYYLYVNQSGKTPLLWTATQSATTWLRLKHFSGETPSSINFEVDTTSTAVGTYSATITVAQTDNPRISFVIPITLTAFEPSTSSTIPTVHLSGDLNTGPAILETTLDGDTRNVGWVDYYARQKNGCQLPIGQKITSPYRLSWNFVDTERSLYIIDGIVARVNFIDKYEATESAVLKTRNLSFRAGCYNDIDQNGIINEQDIELVRPHLGKIEGKDESFSSVYDVNFDGFISQVDIDKIQEDANDPARRYCSSPKLIRTEGGWNKIVMSTVSATVQGAWDVCLKSSKPKSFWQPFFNRFKSDWSLIDYPFPGETRTTFLHCSL